MESLSLEFILVRVQCPDDTSDGVSKFMRSRDLHSDMYLESRLFGCILMTGLVTKKHLETSPTTRSWELLRLQRNAPLRVCLSIHKTDFDLSPFICQLLIYLSHNLSKAVISCQRMSKDVVHCKLAEMS